MSGELFQNLLNGGAVSFGHFIANSVHSRGAGGNLDAGIGQPGAYGVLGAAGDVTTGGAEHQSGRDQPVVARVNPGSFRIEAQ